MSSATKKSRLITTSSSQVSLPPPPPPPPLAQPNLPTHPLPPPPLQPQLQQVPQNGDQLQSAVLRYLQKRRYAPSMAEAYRKLSTTANAGKNGAHVTQTKQQMALGEVIRSEAGAAATLALAPSPNIDPLVVEQQYTKFKVWISESLDSYKPELAQLLYPMFTHLYLDLITSGHKIVAQKFHKRHQSTFLGNPNFASFIRLLSNINAAEDISKDEAVSAFESTKYSVTLSNKTFHYLIRYLQQQQHSSNPPVLLHILHSKVDVRLSDALGAPSSKWEAVQRVKSDNEFPKQENGATVIIKTEAVSSFSGTTVDTSQQHLLEVVRAVRDGPSPLPSTCLYKLNNDNSSVTCSVMSNDTRLAASCAEDSSVTLWNMLPPGSDVDGDETAHTMKDWAVTTDQDPSAIRLGCDDKTVVMTSKKHHVLRAHRGPVYGAAFVPRGQFLVSVSEDTTMRAWQTSNGVNRAVYRGHAYPVWCVDTDQLGVNIATGSMDRTAKLWHLEYTYPLRVYAGHERDVDVVRFHPNCNYLATGSADKTVRLWSHADAKMVRVFSGHRGGIYALAFSPDGKMLASAGEDRRIRIWDLATSALFKELKGHTETIYSLVWSGNSCLLASGGMDGCIKLWDVKTCKTDDSIANGPSSTDGPSSSGGGNKSVEMVASYPTNCANIIDLCYSPHNTLMATGLASSTANNMQMKANSVGMANGSRTRL